jgi:hypothetical protein
MLRYAQPVLGNKDGEPIEASKYQRLQNANSANYYVLDSQAYISPDAATQQVVSPEMTAYAVTTFSLGSGSNDTGSLVARPVSSQPTFNVAITRWFDMPVGDSAFENGFSNFDIGLDEPNNMDTPRDLGGHAMPYMGPCNEIPSVSRVDTASPSSSNPQLLERSASGPNQNATIEKLKWQAPSTIELLPYEHFIFRNFVQRISHWV